jgi:hypothetical protein
MLLTLAGMTWEHSGRALLHKAPQGSLLARLCPVAHGYGHIQEMPQAQPVIKEALKQVTGFSIIDRSI